MSYLTIGGIAEGFYKEKGSKFLAFAYPVSDEGDVKQHLDSLRKTYFDARHHCYAYVLGMEQPRFRANDDGEPSHSAGDPILGQIRSCGLTNTLVVVVRYFGGTKLGVGGLVQAYKTAASEALSSAPRMEIFPVLTFRLSYSYAQIPEVERLVQQEGITVTDRQFSESCILLGEIRKSEKEKFVLSLENSQVQLVWID
ncbi:MAG: YigZ family protein [Cyclobacteriaceae bacterium]|nr:YigZ family protein [Cyclobacteriaceae bacterium]